jgi:hypothetical protein
MTDYIHNCTWEASVAAELRQEDARAETTAITDPVAYWRLRNAVGRVDRQAAYDVLRQIRDVIGPKCQVDGTECDRSDSRLEKIRGLVERLIEAK